MNKALKEWGRVFIDAAIVVFVLYVLLWPVRIDGISMENTLYHNDRIVISRLLGKMSLYDTGDLVVFNYYENGKKLQVIKRVAAMEGDTVTIHNGVVSVNGTALEESYIKGTTEGEISLTVPEEHIFVLGDNRENSEDSRYMGAIAEKEIVGKVIFRWYPFQKITLYY